MQLTRRGFFRFIGRSIGAGLTLGAYGVGIEARGAPVVTTYRLTPPNWPKDLKLKAAVLADIHACDPWMSAARIASIADRTNALGADIIFLLGDYVSGTNMVRSFVPSKDWSKSLARLSAPLGVHAVLGNHDWWEDLEAQRTGGGETFCQRAFAEIGVPVYHNQSVRLEKDGHGFWLAGLGDQLALRPGKRFGRTAWAGLDDLPATLAMITDDAPVILLAHEPDIFPEVPGRVSLTLSGHTHGGQVNLFGWTPVVPSRYGSRYAYGHIVEGDRNLIVSGGLGCSVLPLRFGSWPEILMLELG